MSKLFLLVYGFLNKNKAAFIAINLLILVPIIYFASQLRLEEDVSKMMPIDKRIEKLTQVFQNSKFADKLVFNIHLKDTSKTDPQTLIQYADQLADSLKKRQPKQIKEITYQVSFDSIASVFQNIHEHLPLFLEEEDYAKIEKSLNDTALEKIVNRNFRTLMSPASAVLKEGVISDPLGMTYIGLQKLQKMQVSDNYEIVDGHIMTKDKKNLLFFVVPGSKSNETGNNTLMVAAIDSNIAALKNLYKDRIEAEYFGPAAIAVANADQLKTDIQVTSTVATIVMIFGIYWFYRQKRIFILIFLPVLFGTGFALAMMYLLKTKISAIALGMGSVLLGVTIDYSLHTITHYKNVTSPRQLLSDIASPIMVCSLTTVGTLLGLLFVKAEALQEMGMFSAFNVLGAAVFSITALPVILSWSKSRKNHDADTIQIQQLEGWMSYPFHQHKWLNTFIFVAFGFCLFYSNGVGFEDSMDSINYMPKHLKTAEDHLDAINNYRLKNIFLVSNGKTLEDALRTNETVDKQLKQLQNQHVVEQFTNVSPLFMSQQMQEEKIVRWNKFWTAERKQLVHDGILKNSVALGFNADAFNGFFTWLNQPFQQATPKQLQPIVNLVLKDYITDTLKEASVVSLVRVTEKHNEQVYKTFEPNSDVVVFDKRYLANKLIQLIKQDFHLLLWLSFLIVLVLLVISYGDLLLALIVMLPVVISWYITLGIMTALGIKFNIISIIISTFLYGVGIDYSVFVMRGLLQEFREGIDHLASYKTSVFLSAFTSVAGAAALFLAVHPALRSVAFSVTLGSVSIVVFAYTIVPAVFYWLVRNKHQKLRKYPITLMVLFDTVFFYLMVVLGSISVPFLGLFIYAAFIIPMKTRKLIFHYLLFAWGRFYIFTVFRGTLKVINPHNETFDKPAIIICNHRSLLDTPAMLRLHPKLIIITNDWVRSSPLFGPATRFSDMYSVSSGVDVILPSLQKLINEGYSIVMFPEGTRSRVPEVQRFHKGAFYMAEKLQVDIVPLFLQGTGYPLNKNEFWGKMHTISMKINERITPDDKRFGETYTERAKKIRKYYQEHLATFLHEQEDAKYLSVQLKDNYRYKGFGIEWQLRKELRHEKNFELLHKVVSPTGNVAVLYSGYGFSSYMLHFLSRERNVFGYDADKDKVLLANNCVDKNELITFSGLETFRTEATKFNTIILEHTEEIKGEWAPILIKNLEALNENGTFIIYGKHFREHAKATEDHLTKLLPNDFEIKINTQVADYPMLMITRR